MATTSENSNYYIADYPAQATKIYFDLDPMVAPYAKPNRSVGEGVCISDGTNPGQWKTLDNGAATNSRTFDIQMQYAEPATVAALQALFDTIGQVVYSPDDGNTQYRCSWMPGNSFDPVPIPGLSVFEVAIKLRLQEVLSS